jgi:hypothetical protein
MNGKKKELAFIAIMLFVTALAVSGCSNSSNDGGDLPKSAALGSALTPAQQASMNSAIASQQAQAASAAARAVPPPTKAPGQ